MGTEVPPRVFNHILVIDDEEEILSLYKDMLESQKFCVTVASDTFEAERIISQGKIDLVISDIQMPRRDGIQFLRHLRAKQSNIPPFIFVTGFRDHSILEKANQLGATEILQKPISKAELVKHIRIMEKRGSGLVDEVMGLMKSIGGLTLGESKRDLVENRLNRRAIQLGLKNIEEYKTYFDANRQAEFQEVVSHITTHHTFFFREPEHFQFLENENFQKMAKQHATIKIWSAASSTGEEPYSIAICYLEYLRKSGIDKSAAAPLKVFGSDIDEKSLAIAKQGVYELERVKNLPPDILRRYFDVGSGDLKGLVRIKSEVHDLCEFGRWNLQSFKPPHENCDVIFLRNVLIYFHPDDIRAICSRLTQSLKIEGCLILGISESLQGSGTTLESIGKSVYRRTNEKPSTRHEAPIVAPLAGSEIKVFIVDDSNTIRSMIKKVLSTDPMIKIVGEAANPVEAQPLIAKTKPDVMTLDIHMPVMDGVSYLRSVQGEDHPRVIMVSSVSLEDAAGAMQCFELGAYDYIEKPDAGSMLNIGAVLLQSVKDAALSPKRAKRRSAANTANQAVPYDAADVDNDLILIGASTGGVEALREVLQGFSEICPPILIVQHIPPAFSLALANRLNTLCKIKVSQAEDGEVIEPGHAYIAPGGKQLGIERKGKKIALRLTDDPPVNRFRPSVDYLFNSVVKANTRYRISAAILTGMGGDGAHGMLALRNQGAHTIAQDKDSCVVFGMPKVAQEIGAAVEVQPLHSISYHLIKGISKLERKDKAS